MSTLLVFVTAVCCFLTAHTNAYPCIITEDSIPAPYNAKHCIMKIKTLLARQSASFSVEIVKSDETLRSNMNEIAEKKRISFDGELVREKELYRELKAFSEEGVKNGVTTALSTALGMCALSIVDNFRGSKMWNLKEWIDDIMRCGKEFDWNAMFVSSIVWGTSSAAVNGGLASFQQSKIEKWTYYPYSEEKCKKLTKVF
mmetsp:Transcript_5312/g.8727  ORF Transcript_5312/g.8727 Transcript_5312/m.8727 type:complete len:200 (+) Transcript_5312:36-635(+)